jgi:tetratricopeptide (TPR) repeat protein
VAFLLKDYEASAASFEKALKAQPDNKAALIGLARARYELDSFAEADDLFARVKSMDPALADQFAYLASKVDASTALRASSAAADRGGGMTWDQDQEE